MKARQAWSVEMDERLKKLWDAGVLPKDIATRMRVTVPAIYGRQQAMRLPKRTASGRKRAAPEVVGQNPEPKSIVPETAAFSVARVNALLALRQEGVEWLEILAAVNKLPGPRIATRQALWTKFGLLRKAVLAQQNSRGMRRAATAAAPDGALMVTYQFARRFAIQNKLIDKRAALNLVAVNAARAMAGEPVFVLHGAL